VSQRILIKFNNGSYFADSITSVIPTTDSSGFTSITISYRIDGEKATCSWNCSKDEVKDGVGPTIKIGNMHFQSSIAGNISDFIHNNTHSTKLF